MSFAWQSVDEFLRLRGIKVGAPTASQTTGGRHEPTSFHYVGRARDYGRNTGSDPDLIARTLEALAVGSAAPVIELFYSPLDIFYKNGVKIIPSDALRAQHQDHVHVALRSGIDLSKYGVVLGAGVGLIVLGIAALIWYFRD